MPSPAEPPRPSKPGSAKEEIFGKLRAKAKGATPPADPVSPPAVDPTQKTAGTPPADPKPPGSAAPDPGVSDPSAATDPNAPKPGEGQTDPAHVDAKDGKTNPWKLVERYKTRAAELEKQVAEAKTNALAEQERKKYLEQIEQVTKRRDELENEIRFVNYSKSEEYVAKFQKPYEEAWQRAASELSEIVYTDPATRETRTATADDLMQLINLPLSQAREIADTVFGKFANDVMVHRKEIRKLFEAQSAALKEAREKGAEREKQQAEMTAKQRNDISEYLAKTWAEVNKTVLTDPKHGKWFAPIEGDQDGNSRLAKGFEMVDRAFNENPSDPKLTTEQRAEMLKRHAAVRNRAAAFGRLRAMYEKAEKQIAELTKELEDRKRAVPPTGGGTQPPAPGAGGPKSAREEVFGRLRSMAK